MIKTLAIVALLLAAGPTFAGHGSYAPHDLRAAEEALRCAERERDQIAARLRAAERDYGRRDELARELRRAEAGYVDAQRCLDEQEAVLADLQRGRYGESREVEHLRAEYERQKERVLCRLRADHRYILAQQDLRRLEAEADRARGYVGYAYDGRDRRYDAEAAEVRRHIDRLERDAIENDRELVHALRRYESARRACVPDFDAELAKLRRCEQVADEAGAAAAALRRELASCAADDSRELRRALSHAEAEVCEARARLTTVQNRYAYDRPRDRYRRW